jgi:hypothetical protein
MHLTQAKLQALWVEHGGARVPLLLQCMRCSAEYSANPNDYYLTDPGEVHLCGCGGNLALVRQIVSYRRIWPRKRGGT